MKRFWIFACALATIALIVGLEVFLPVGDPTDLDTLLRRMASDGEQFRPLPLHMLGVNGLSDVLKFLETRYPTDANSSAGTIPFSKASLAEGFDVYASEINDRDRLLLLAGHLNKHLKDGLYYDETDLLAREKMSIIRSCVKAFARNDQDQDARFYAMALRPCLQYGSGLVGEWLIQSLDGHDNGTPLIAYDLKIEALSSPFPGLVSLALEQASECARTNRRQDVNDRLIPIFNGSNDDHKFHASFALMHEFKYQPAIDYLLEQTASNKKERVQMALLWIGDPCNWGRTEYPALLKAFDPLLKSRDRELRGGAVESLATYAGPGVTNRLLAALGDDDPSIVEIVHNNLAERATAPRGNPLSDPDLIAKLKELSETHVNERVRIEAAVALQHVNERLEAK